MKKQNCWGCVNRRESYGNCHIGCAAPPDAVVLIGSGGKERIELAQKFVEKALKEKNIHLAVRCIWPRSGVFPVLYDGNTVFACANMIEGKPQIRKSSQFERMWENFQKGLPPVLGELKIEKVSQ